MNCGFSGVFSAILTGYVPISGEISYDRLSPEAGGQNRIYDEPDGTRWHKTELAGEYREKCLT